MAEEEERIWIDCEKTRAVAEEWRLSGKPMKSLAPANLLDSITGKNGERFKRVKQGTLDAFSEGCGRDTEVFRADEAELRVWREKHANQPRSGKRGASSTGNSRAVGQLYKRLSGYYELYHYATSTKEAQKISVCLLHIDGVDEPRSIIRCELYDGTQARPYFKMAGSVCENSGFLEWSLAPDGEPVRCHGYSYLPTGEKYPGLMIDGIFMSLSGDGKLDYPVAARGTLRFIGETADDGVRNSVVDLAAKTAAPDVLLKTSVGGYLADLRQSQLLRTDIFKEIETKILPKIKNEIAPDATPRALTAPR